MSKLNLFRSANKVIVLLNVFGDGGGGGGGDGTLIEVVVLVMSGETFNELH